MVFNRKMQTGHLYTQCSQNGESAKNIQREIYKKSWICISLPSSGKYTFT